MSGAKEIETSILRKCRISFARLRRIEIDHMENDARITWNELPVFAPTEWYGCIPLPKVSRNRNDLEQGEPVNANRKTCNSLLEKKRDLILFAEYTVIVPKSKNGAETSRKNFQN